MENADSIKIVQITTGSLIDAYRNELSVWDSQGNASEEKERALARLRKIFCTPAGTTCVNQHFFVK
jgi:hypothetical protein